MYLKLGWLQPEGIKVQKSLLWRCLYLRSHPIMTERVECGSFHSFCISASYRVKRLIVSSGMISWSRERRWASQSGICTASCCESMDMSRVL